MKQLVISLIAAMYALASTGTAVELHYCMGKMVDWSFVHSSAPSCNKCGMEKEESGNHCCKDEQKYFKSLDDQKVNHVQQEFSKLSVLLTSQVSALRPPPPALSGMYKLEVANSPPLNNQDLFLRNCSFLL